MQPHEKHIANLVVAETEDNDEPKCFPTVNHLYP